LWQVEAYSVLLTKIEIENEQIQFSSQVMPGVCVGCSMEQLMQIEDLISHFQFGREAVGVLENLIGKPQFLWNRSIIIQGELLAFTGQVVERALLLRLLYSLFNNPLQEFHN